MRFLLVLFFLCIFLQSCNSIKKENAKEGKLFVQDFRGKEIHLKMPATRIVCLVESTLTGFYMLNSEDKIVGVPLAVYNESNAKFYAAMDDRIRKKELVSPGNWDFLNMETLLSLQPDLVIIWASQKESIDAIEQHNIPVYAVMLEKVEDIYKEIKDLGIITSSQGRADSLIDYTKEISALNIKFQQNKPKVYFTWPQGLLETSGANSILQQVLDKAGVENICKDSTEHIVMSMEKLVAGNPEYIIAWKDDKDRIEEILSNTQLKSVRAFKNKNVYQMPSAFWCDMWTLKYPLAVRYISVSCNINGNCNFDWEQEKVDMSNKLYGNKAKSLLAVE
jgi:iron complex transport system substrate-binding protein